MTKISSPLPDKDRKATGDALQGALVDLIDVSLQAKQAHWNLIGPHFRSLHLLLDEVVAVARTHMDLLAERAIAIGVNPDGRPGTVVRTTHNDQIKEGYISDKDVINTFTALLGSVVGRFREAIEATDEPDPVSQDLLIQASRDLEEKHWMFQAQQ